MYFTYWYFCVPFVEFPTTTTTPWCHSLQKAPQRHPYIVPLFSSNRMSEVVPPPPDDTDLLAPTRLNFSTDKPSTGSSSNRSFPM